MNADTAAPPPTSEPVPERIPAPSSRHARTDPPRPARILKVVLPILVVALLSIAIVPATVPATAQGAIAGFLPDPTRTDSLRKVPDNQGSWQSQQHLVGASNGYGDLAEPTQQSLGYGNNLGAPELHGQWLQVNILNAGATVAIRTLNFHLADNQITLQALEYPSSWQTFSPGLPVLSPELLAGRRVHWSGTDTFGIGGKAGDRAEASAEISTGLSVIGPDCVDTTVKEQISGAGSATRVVSWCRGDQPGWAGLTQGGDGVIRAARPSSHAAVETTSRPAEPPRTLTGTIRKPTFYQVVNEIPFEKATAPSPVRIASADRTLVIGDHDGRVTAWRELDLDQPGQSGYELAWEAVPGGVITNLSTIGSVTAVSTARDRVLGYADDGWLLWEHDSGDVVVSMIRSDTDVLVLTAAGRLRALDAATGTERWRRTFAAGATVTAGAAGVVVQDGDQVTTLSPSTGRQLWQSQIPGALLAATDRTLTVATSRQLSALDLNDGRVLWRVRGPNPPGGLVAGAGQVIRTNAAGTVCFDAGNGTIRWRAPAAETVLASGDLTVLVYPDRLELADAAGLGQSWTYPAGFARPSHLQPTATGVMAFQLGPDDLWWDYR